MSTLHMLIGIPGSGKSTYCRNVLIPKLKDSIYVASDKIRDNNPNMPESEVFPTMHKITVKALNEGKDVIYDATNITPEVRKLVFDGINSLNVNKYDSIAYYFNTDPNKCYERVLLRNKNPNERFLPVEIISGYGESIIAPTKDEGFKEIIIIDNNKDVVRFDKLTNFNEKEA